MKATNKNIENVIDLCAKLLYCADQGDMQREDDSCGVLYGIVRDSAYKMLDAAERERKRHMEKGVWDDDCKD